MSILRKIISYFGEKNLIGIGVVFLFLTIIYILAVSIVYLMIDGDFSELNVYVAGFNVFNSVLVISLLVRARRQVIKTQI